MIRRGFLALLAAPTAALAKFDRSPKPLEALPSLGTRSFVGSITPISSPALIGSHAVMVNIIVKGSEWLNQLPDGPQEAPGFLERVLIENRAIPLPEPGFHRSIASVILSRKDSFGYREIFYHAIDRPIKDTP